MTGPPVARPPSFVPWIERESFLLSETRDRSGKPHPDYLLFHFYLHASLILRPLPQGGIQGLSFFFLLQSSDCRVRATLRKVSFSFSCLNGCSRSWGAWQGNDHTISTNSLSFWKIEFEWILFQKVKNTEAVSVYCDCKCGRNIGDWLLAW